ncbi:hypothetical protein PF008_g30906 [Phytophthora fragariae]|uniref:Secreted protein n=1 Tax=Phytophthora fragariae TaxID=53985 RepID=A0A6G0Q455_9STRA|nr:hypothetical protein PF008_g30906 [Phytophthora fragariae]
MSNKTPAFAIIVLALNKNIIIASGFNDSHGPDPTMHKLRRFGPSGWSIHPYAVLNCKTAASAHFPVVVTSLATLLAFTRNLCTFVTCLQRC